MSDIIENLESLSPEELEKVANLINKFAKRKKSDEGDERPRKRKRKKQRVDETNEELIVEEQTGRKKPRKRIVMNEDEEVERPRTVGRGRTQPRRQSSRRNRKTNHRGNQGRSKGVMARTEKVELSNQNRFMQMRERNSHKQDAKIDKKLWQGREVTSRPDEYEPIEVQCKECELWYDVNPNVVMIDRDTGDYNYTCNNCVRR